MYCFNPWFVGLLDKNITRLLSLCPSDSVSILGLLDYWIRILEEFSKTWADLISFNPWFVGLLDKN